MSATPNHRPHAHCCPCGPGTPAITRRTFLVGAGGVALSAPLLAGWKWGGGEEDAVTAPQRAALVVKPVLTYSLPTRRPQASWRSWGGIETQVDVEQELARIGDELPKLAQQADYPVRFLPCSAVDSVAKIKALPDLGTADAVLVYAAGGWNDLLAALVAAGKPTIFFLRHRSGPVSLWYEIIHPRYLRAHGDALAVPGLDYQDVVVDSPAELDWRLRALCGLKNTLGARIVALGGASGWECPAAPDLARQRFNLDIRTLSYDELGELIRPRRADQAAVGRARRAAAEYLAAPGVTLETERSFVENAFLLEQILRQVLKQADARALTINGCMETIMPLAETSACLTLSLLNDGGYLAFCESDFVVIPSGLLLAAIAGRPVFLNDPTFAHDGLITLAHCTAPRRLDGRALDPARLLTHFESDYGAAPKVEMRVGQCVTMIAPDFAGQRWMGLLGKILANPFLPICRSQVDVGFDVSAERVNAAMPGFHWMLAYGDYQRELGYALRRVGIRWDFLA